jgi:hypothetical protein
VRGGQGDINLRLRSHSSFYRFPILVKAINWS